MRASRFFAPVLILGILGILGCDRGGTSDNTVGGTLIIATPADGEPMIPAVLTALSGKQITDQIFEYLADIGPDLNAVGTRGFTPRLASRWEWAPDSMSIAFHIDARARWHDGRPVRAQDVRFSFQMFVNPDVASLHAEGFNNIDSVSVRDSLTAVVWYKKRQPTQFFEVANNLAVVPEHLLKDVKPADLRSSAFARSPVGSGPFRFSRWEPGAIIEIVADTAHYRGRPKLDRVIWSITPDPTTATTRVLAGEADLNEAMRGDALQRVNDVPTIHALIYPGMTFGAFVVNMTDGTGKRPHPIFGERATRVALAMAIDRASSVTNVLDTLGLVASGPFTRAVSTFDSTIAQIPFDAAGSRRMLDSLGWRDTNGDSLRERNGIPLAFRILVPTTSVIRQRLAVLLQDQFAKVGAKVTIDGYDMATFRDQLTTRSFDTFLNGWIVDPNPGSVRNSWSSDSRAKGGGNFASYSNPTFDAVIDTAALEFDDTKSKALYRRAYEILIADAPAVFIYELRNTLVVHKRFQISGIRPDAWWSELYKWSVPADQRIERDRLGAGTGRP